MILFSVVITFIYFYCLSNYIKYYSIDREKLVEDYMNTYFKYLIGILKRFVGIFLIVTLFNYATILYHETSYITPIVIDYQTRNTSVYYQCLIIDKFSSKLDLLLTYT